MCKDAQQSIALTDETQKKFDEFVAAMMTDRFGPEGPAEDTTFAEMEEFGHEVGRMVARALEANLAVAHQRHFGDECPCPICETLSPLKKTAERPFQTTDGKVPLCELVYHCPVCNRDFFPSAYHFAD